MSLILSVKPFSFRLLQVVTTTNGSIDKKQGWLLNITDQLGNQGWGEVSPFEKPQLKKCEEILETINRNISRKELEAGTQIWPAALAFGIGAALAELDGVIGSKSQTGWLKAPSSTILLPHNDALLDTVESLVEKHLPNKVPLTVKWKIAINSQEKEEGQLHQILNLLPPNGALRLDANTGLTRGKAKRWAKYFHQDPRLEWLEQPLPIEDFEGLLALSKEIPIALDESLIANPRLRRTWKSWQVRRPLIEGDPRILLDELNQRVGKRVVSTAFETGIGRRWIEHLSALQQQGPTPTAPGLAPGYCPDSPLFAKDPLVVWEAA